MRKGKLIIYWDYELQQGADTSTLKYQDGIEDYHQTESILNQLKKHDLKTCFAVLGYAAEKGDLPYHAPQQIQQMAEAGHEVGSHTQNHQRISNLSYPQLLQELKQSKENIEKITRTKCTAFVPPWDKPQYFFSNGVDFKPGSFIPHFSKLNLNQICSALKTTGYLTYRVCPLTSRFTKFKLSKLFRKKNITCIPSRMGNGFDIQAKRLVKKAILNRGLAVVYAHPRGLAHPGPQNKVYFEDFIRFTSKLVADRKLEMILPQELTESPMSKF
tara:strand:+ start:2555 stop:3370 length:816 start_codon:yes stop_codon:yes gene_type:complete